MATEHLIAALGDFERIGGVVLPAVLALLFLYSAFLFVYLGVTTRHSRDFYFAGMASLFAGVSALAF